MGILGLTLTPEIARAMHLPADQQGVLVEQLERGGPADQVGVRGSSKRVVVEARHQFGRVSCRLLLE